MEQIGCKRQIQTPLLTGSMLRKAMQVHYDKCSSI